MKNVQSARSSFEGNNTPIGEEKSSRKLQEDRFFIAVLFIGVGIGAYLGWLLPVFLPAG